MISSFTYIIILIQFDGQPGTDNIKNNDTLPVD